MSLNGLDNPAVIEAYQTALSEAGGWFLLRYVSRDEVALLDRGTGGVPDVRNAIDGYEECSPLYGFLQYRRRKVVLSYMPEDLSRLIRARTTVQFQSVLDRFSPHDTVFSLSQPSDLTESALSSACLLHTASGSITSSSSSLRRRRLMEIAEDAEENPTAKEGILNQDPVQDMRQRSFSQLSESTVVPAPSIISNAQHTTNGDGSIPMSPNTNSRAPSIIGDTASERPTSSRNFRDDLSYAPSEPRKSTQSARPSLRDLERAAGLKPKVKLGPRPVDGSGRPRTAGNSSRATEQRPVASLPAGFRSSSLRKSNPSPTRPRSQGNPVLSTSGRKVPPVPPLLVPPPSVPISRPQLSPGAKSLSALSSIGASHEKERLMKALQMRKTQMEKRAQELKSEREAKGSTQESGENKENMVVQIYEKPSHDRGADRLSKISEQGTERLSETLPTVALQPIQVPEQVDDVPTPVPTQEEPSAIVSTLNGYKASDESSDPEPESFNVNGPTEAQTPQILPEIGKAEIEFVEEDLAVSAESKTKSGTGSPSAVLDVPLEDKPETAPEEIIITAPLAPPPQINEHTENETPNPAEPVEPQSIPLPGSPSPDLQAESVVDIPTTIIPHIDELQHELTPESLSAQPQRTTSRKDKRKPLLEPIQVPTSEYSDEDNLLSDDSFMEELKSATVQEAKPISVGKSPLSPGYSKNGSGNTTPDAWRNSRAVSNPSAIGRQFSGHNVLAVGRSISSPFSELENSSASPVLVAKKINVSSGISKRIKALEKFSNNRDSTPIHTPSVATPSASSFETLRKRASISLGTGNSDATPLSRPPSYNPETFSRASSIRRRDSQSSATTPRVANSVSVTARIVRNQATPGTDSNTDLSEPRGLNLQASSLTVEHGTSSAPSLPSPPSEPPTVNKLEKRSMSTSSAGSGPHPSTIPLPRSESRLSISSTSRNDGFPPRSPSDVSSSPEEKKESRTSRILRRMSSITSSSRRGTISSRNVTLKEEDSMPPVEEVSRQANELPEAIDIGEVNVQFPDTLLWKRRFIRVDSKGYLVLTPGNIDSSNRNMIKRYHLSEFRTPCLPDEDRQELPNSILLDFLDGSTLQCACESRQGQAFVLQTLVNAHSNHRQHLS